MLAWTRDRAPEGARSDDELAVEWLRLEQLHFADYLIRETSFEEQRRRRLREYLAFLDQVPVPDETLDTLFEDYLKHYEQAWTAYDDAVLALSALKNRRLTLGVLTNGQEAQQRAKLAAVGLLPFFDYVVASSTLSASKPAPAAFDEACQRIGHPPGDVLYVGDNLQTDALAATEAGLVGVWLNRRGAPSTDEPTYCITSLTEVVDLIENPR